MTYPALPSRHDSATVPRGSIGAPWKYLRIMHRASRYRPYPNRTQERQFARLCGAGRFVYNELLLGR